MLTFSSLPCHPFFCEPLCTGIAPQLMGLALLEFEGNTSLELEWSDLECISYSSLNIITVFHLIVSKRKLVNCS